MEFAVLAIQQRFLANLRRLLSKRINTARSIKDQNGVIISSEGDILGRWREYIKDLLNPR